MCHKNEGTRQGTINSIDSGSIPGTVICAHDTKRAMVHMLVFTDSAPLCEGQEFENQKFYTFKKAGYDAVVSLINDPTIPGVDLWGESTPPGNPDINNAGWWRAMP